MRHVLEPTLVVEVLSPSTALHDYDVKAPAYRAVASVREVLLISAQHRHATLWRREGGRWAFYDFIGDATLALEALTAPLALAEVYAGVVDV